MPWITFLIGNHPPRFQCYTFTEKKLYQHIFGFEMELHNMIVIHIQFSLLKWICKKDIAQTTLCTVVFTEVAQHNVDGWIDGAGKGEESWYPGCIHPSFNRQTLTTLQESMNILYNLTCMKWFLHAQNTRTVFLVFCLLHKCLATVLVEIVLYFPCALAPFHIFQNFTRCVCERKSSLVVKCSIMA